MIDGVLYMDIENTFILSTFVFIFAFGEEILKASLVYISKGTIFIIPAILVLPSLEAILYYPEMYQHSLDLGVQENLALPYTLLVIIGAKLFHVATSIFYYHSKHIYTYVIFGTSIHFMHNIFIDYLPTLSLWNYTVVPWILSLYYALIMYIFHRVMKRYYS